MEPDTSSLDQMSVFLPILFLIVVELSAVARRIDVKELSNSIRPKLHWWWFTVPNLGRFIYIHTACLSILSFALFIGLNIASGLLSAGVVLASIILMLILPLIEIEEYDSLLYKKDSLDSYRFHFLLVGGLALLFSMYPLGSTVLQLTGGPLAQFSYLVLVLAIFPVFGSVFFVRRLEADLQSIVSSYKSGVVEAVANSVIISLIVWTIFIGVTLIAYDPSIVVELVQL